MKKLLYHVYNFFKPSWCLALLVALEGYLFAEPVIFQSFHYIPDSVQTYQKWKDVFSVVNLLDIPRGLLGVALILMSVGLLLHARVAWAFTLLLLFVITILSLIKVSGQPVWQTQDLVHLLWHNLRQWQDISLNNLGNYCHNLTVYPVVLIIFLIHYRDSFDRASLAAGGLFALVSFSSLLTYAIFGALYLGDEFKPPIMDMITAFYFSVVSMSTVGFGDIVPSTPLSRLFTISVIMMGITVFATSISAIIGPVIGGSLKRMVQGRISHVMRKNHFIITGTSPLALSIYNRLKERNDAITVVVPAGVVHEYPQDADVVSGDPASAKTLIEAGAQRAKYILALHEEDAENVFIILAAKEVAGSTTRTISLVNASKHLQKIKQVHPDMVFSLQLLGSELLVRTLSDEAINNKLITQLFFGNISGAGDDQSSDTVY
ncbi:TPA: voltage-gated potassium channel protein [Salmonella enterica subsp. enterica serovar Eastbourne]|uniref:Voltage-gated potassium channel protein n=3 Tax=Salmonella enterica TaxID=28901 RepID=A0A765FSM9_SALER|nr:voltage-gated potassium channel protein [Salmonella enterica]ECA1898473.1 voltage-gated potassium channel protein [Salmonella enterica subsp. enterica serovar Eastbourne]HAC6678995.1 voltage-gated potassium channel protein [Salmonella enterica subsp. enterica serovar Eastbourne]HAE5116495.1 voltage-gated potassium channel protein [Salmonella enterica subsp. enterica serovar Eastbourne]HAE8030883.1 voltage-gated potassium channel protein [Salmonella enterica subsp. enterica serovar Eastbourne